MDYAVVETGGKQYRVSEGDLIEVERLAGAVGDVVELHPVLMIRHGEEMETDPDKLANASVRGQIVRHGRGKKVMVFKFKRRKNVRRKLGHRQGFTAVRITDIVSNGAAGGT